MKLAALALLLAGCATPGLPAPLLRVAEVPGLGADRLVTVGTTLLAEDWGRWQAAHPEPWLTAVLLHEAEHARRQIAAGLGTWLLRYALEPGFAWAEERLGWEVELRYLAQHGVRVPPEQVVAWLMAYGPWPYGRIASEAEVWAWASHTSR